jgi:hypothetical protein
MLKNQKHCFFVDESGDPNFFDKKGNFIVGKEGCSKILILGFIKTEDPKKIRKEIFKLHDEIKNDDYLKAIPSILKTNIHFHAKDDVPEVREKVFKMIKKLDFKAQFVVARKKLDIFTQRHEKNEDKFYNEIVSHLFENNLHQNDNMIYFSKRGSSTKQYHLETAIKKSISIFEKKHNEKIDTETKVFIQNPTDEICLQLVDYVLWAVQRAFAKNESRYFDFISEKISLIWDIYDFENERYGKNIYYENNKFVLNKISPL